MSEDTRFFDDTKPLGDLDVVFIVNSSGEKLVREFKCYRAMKKFICDSRHSNKITLVIYPNL